MYPEDYEGFHYVTKDSEPVEREVVPLSERIPNQNLWQGRDWYFYHLGQRDGDLGINKRCQNSFYLLGYQKEQDKYTK